jgi:ABC-2 type transport system ATP-binding protein
MHRSNALIEVEGIHVAFNGRAAVDGISFRAESGSVYGLLGPNGAGKSTTIGCLSGLIAPDAGSVRIHGEEVAPGQPRVSLGIVPQELAVYQELSPAENLAYWGEVYGIRGAALRARVDELLEKAGLVECRNDRVRSLSGGTQRRLNFVCALIHAPMALLLDEPTVGVDPQARARILELVREEANRGVCVVFSTHYMEEAEGLCDRIGILDHGHIIAEGDLAELRRLHAAPGTAEANLEHIFMELTGSELRG